MAGYRYLSGSKDFACGIVAPDRAGKIFVEEPSEVIRNIKIGVARQDWPGPGTGTIQLFQCLLKAAAGLASEYVLTT